MVVNPKCGWSFKNSMITGAKTIESVKNSFDNNTNVIVFRDFKANDINHLILYP